MPTEGCAVYYGNFMELKMAKLSCIADSDCKSVVDEGCDLESPFQLCRKESYVGALNIERCIDHLKRQGKKLKNLRSFISLFISMIINIWNFQTQLI